MKYFIFICLGTLILSCNASKPAPGPTAATKPAGIESRETARTSYTCLGNEPFWSVQVKGNEIIFSTPEEGPLSYPYQAPQQKGSRKVFESKAGSSTIRVAIEEVACTDSMSGERFPYTAEITKDGKIYRGCAK